MNIHPILFAAVIAAAATTAVSHAAEPKKEPAIEAAKSAGQKEAPKAKQDAYPLYGKVVAVTSRTLTIVRSDAPDAEQSKYNLNASVEYVNGEKPATFEDVKVGSWVGGSIKKNAGDGNDTVVKLNVGVKQKTAKKSAKSPAKKKTTATKK